LLICLYLPLHAYTALWKLENCHHAPPPNERFPRRGRRSAISRNPHCTFRQIVIDFTSHFCYSVYRKDTTRYTKMTYTPIPNQPAALLDTVHGPQQVKILAVNHRSPDGFYKYIVTDPFLTGFAIYASENELSEFDHDQNIGDDA